jgi:uncharacterized protein GlcG (DUF336 family)
MSMAVADTGGNLVAFYRMDDAMLSSLQIAIDKAFTAVFSKQATVKSSRGFSIGKLIPLFYHERWITFQGGYPIISNGVILGGIGVSGGIVEDSYVARAALKAGGFSVDEVDAVIAQMESE